MSDWIKLAIAIIGALGGAMTFARWYLDRRDRKAKEHVLDVFGRITEIYREITSLRDILGAARILVLRAENGGEIPRVGHDLHSTVVYETFHAVDAVSERWSQQKMDEEYVRLLARVIAEDQVVVHTDKLKKGHLKDIYLSTGIGHAIVSTLRVSQKEFFYLSIAFTEPPREIGARDRDRIRSTRTRLKRLLKES